MLTKSSVKHTNFDLKHTVVELVPARRRSERAFVTLEGLEATRSQGAVPASKHGLEAICGASCDTAAQ